MKKDLDVWFNSLDLDQLERMFTWPSGHDANDFIDDCDEAWAEMTEEEKERLYNNWN